MENGDKWSSPNLHQLNLDIPYRRDSISMVLVPKTETRREISFDQVFMNPKFERPTASAICF